MKSLKNLAKSASRPLSDADIDHINNQAEIIMDLRDQLQHNQLLLMELEEMVGAITQEREWYATQVEDLKEKLADLEQLVYGLDCPHVRYSPLSHHTTKT